MDRFQVIAIANQHAVNPPSEAWVVPGETTMPDEGICLAHSLLVPEAELVARLYARHIRKLADRRDVTPYRLARLAGLAARHAALRPPLAERHADLTSEGFEPAGIEGQIYAEMFAEMAGTTRE